MNKKPFFMGAAAIIVLIALGFLAYSAYRSEAPAPEETPAVPEEQAASMSERGPATFAWEFEEADTLNLDGMPETAIFLTATYADGSERKAIDVTPGSCNALPDNEADSVEGTEDIQCYSAGLGYRYKITMGEASYRVERQTFEEGLPDYEPPAYEYEVIAEFAR